MIQTPDLKCRTPFISDESEFGLLENRCRKLPINFIPLISTEYIPERSPKMKHLISFTRVQNDAAATLSPHICRASLTLITVIIITVFVLRWFARNILCLWRSAHPLATDSGRHIVSFGISVSSTHTQYLRGFKTYHVTESRHPSGGSFLRQKNCYYHDKRVQRGMPPSLLFPIWIAVPVFSKQFRSIETK